MPSSCDEEKSLPPEISALVWTEQRPRGRKWLRVTEAEGIHHMWEESKHRLVVLDTGLGFLLGLWRASQMFSSEGGVSSFWRNDSGINTLPGLLWNGILRGWHGAKGISPTRKLLLGLLGLMSNLRKDEPCSLGNSKASSRNVS